MAKEKKSWSPKGIVLSRLIYLRDEAKKEKALGGFRKVFLEDTIRLVFDHWDEK